MRWPNTISNNQLYAHCNSAFVCHSTRIQMENVRTVLHMPQDTPAQLALHFAVERLQIHKGRRNIAPLPMLMCGKSEILAPSQTCFGLQTWRFHYSPQSLPMLKNWIASTFRTFWVGSFWNYCMNTSSAMFNSQVSAN